MKSDRSKGFTRWLMILVTMVLTVACSLLNFVPGQNTATPGGTALPVTSLEPEETSLAATVEPSATELPPTPTNPKPTAQLSPQASPGIENSPIPTKTLIPTEGTMVSMKTGILNINTFIQQCPNEDPNFDLMLQSFQILKDGAAVTDFNCSDPFTSMPIAQFTNELISAQAIRLAYYLDTGTPGTLPWTSQSLFDWLTSVVSGVNLVSTPGQTYCCDLIQNKNYIVQSIQSDEQREFKRDWVSLLDTLAYYAHEARHLDGDFGHVTGCEAFPNPDDQAGCDASYDLHNLGPYGIQYWLEYAVFMGYLNVGISCTPDTAQSAMLYLQNNLNLQYRRRFAADVPPIVEMPAPPYGGPCYEE
jgi:hypothetical protein